ncbi:MULTISPECIES: hypothetical protein [Cryobacterium]|uniref:DUF308 domain-containing protein n=1 Tax=Cryobacterium breve TaxID=1259258 RepID=A0ABY2J050_9MICO|nr:MULTISPECIES: hypothetical protein [Cryobacterium]TFC91785.1 hypothetical protein E3T20_13070 [Cryobacterium sp. TmT3-12]TFC98335.1 hypothetical protein E3O65_08290 [Cryobacterium breve]
MENQAHDQARAAFAAIDAGRAAAAERLVTPLWYHPILGILTAGYLAAVTSRSIIVTLVALPIFLAGVFALVSAYKKITGLWISGFNAGRASWWAAAMGAILMVLFSLAYAQVWSVWAAATTAFIAVNVFGLLFDRTLRASLRAGTIADPR